MPLPPLSSLSPTFISISLATVTLVTWYYQQLSIVMNGPHPHASPAKFDGTLDKEKLDAVSYEGVDMLKGIPRERTGKGYAVIGGSGFLGQYIVCLLLLRGESYVRVIDVNPPPSSLLNNPAVTFIKADIATLSSIREALKQPFPSQGSTSTRNTKYVEVIYHTAAVIRFWERLEYTWEATRLVNVQGTENVLTVAKELQEQHHSQSTAGSPHDSYVVVVYTSSTDAVRFAPPEFFKLKWGRREVHSDHDEIIPPESPDRHYSRSKRFGEALIRRFNGLSGLRTGSIRPGCAITGPGDHLVLSTLAMSSPPVWDNNWSAPNVCVWDVAAAHLLLEDALRTQHKDIGGSAFLVTGNGPAWKAGHFRAVIEHYAGRKINFAYINPVFLYTVAHLMEGFLYIRYHFLLGLNLIRGINTKPDTTPKWMGPAGLLQPSTMYNMKDIVIDDSRARKLLGYRPQWETEQYIKWSVDETLKLLNSPEGSAVLSRLGM